MLKEIDGEIWVKSDSMSYQTMETTGDSVYLSILMGDTRVHIIPQRFASRAKAHVVADLLGLPEYKDE